MGTQGPRDGHLLPMRCAHSAQKSGNSWALFLFAQQKAMYAANEELLCMNWDIGEMLTKSQEADGWGKKTLQRLSVDLKNE